MTPEDLYSELESQLLRPAYLITGEESLYREEAVEAIENAVFPDGPVDFDYERLDGATASGSDLLNAIGTLPVLASRRLIVLRMPPPKRGKAKDLDDPEPTRGKAKDLGDAIAESLDVVARGSDAVFVVVASNVEGRARWVKLLGAEASVHCNPPKGLRAIAAWVNAEAKQQGISLGKGAAALLAERTGPNLMMLRHEIAKAALFAGPGEQVTSRHVAEATTDVAEEPIWDLTDAIGDGRIADAMAVLEKLLGAGGAPPAILGALASHFRKLLATRTGGKVAGKPYTVGKLESQSESFSAGRLVSCMRAIHQTDLALKGVGGIPAEISLARLVLGLVPPTTRRRGSA
ncbi:MAG: DNA polymerase III subunit delta [Myxococcota bacterium]